MKSNGKLKVVIGIPNTGLLLKHFVSDLFRMTTAFNTYRVGEAKEQSLHLHWVTGSILPRARMKVVQHAWEHEASHILFLDSDHTFPRNMLHRLILHDKDVVAVNCVTKTIPAQPTARYAPCDGDPGYGVPVFSDENKHGLEEVWRVGTGIMLIKTAVFHKIGLKNFSMFFKDDVNDYQGEDWTMAEAMHNAGYKLYVDHDLSRECGHVGYFEYTHDVVGELVNEPLGVDDGNISGRGLQRAEANDSVDTAEA